jgi:hypothetical protein
LNIDKDTAFAAAVEHLNKLVDKMTTEHRCELLPQDVLNLLKLLNPGTEFSQADSKLMISAIEHHYAKALKLVNESSGYDELEDAQLIYQDVAYGDKLLNPLGFIFYVDGHHRLAWLVTNYFLASVQYTPFYLKPGEYERINPENSDRKGFNGNEFVKIIQERCHYVSHPKDSSGLKI